MAQPKEKWHGRGTATIYEDDSIEFRPCGKGEPSQRNVKRSGASKFYQTNGEKESNYVAHLMAPKDALDPVGDMLMIDVTDHAKTRAYRLYRGDELIVCLS